MIAPRSRRRGDGVEVVAHRAGNAIATVAPAKRIADMLELDVHVLRGRVEVRHEKVLWPTRRLWERWYLLPRATTGVPLADVLAEIGPTMPVMVDLKCFTRRAARKVRAEVPMEQPVVVSTRSWWILGVFEDRRNTRWLRSCGNRTQLWLVERMGALGHDSGVSVHERLLAPDRVGSLRTRTNLVFTWGATSRERCQELIEQGVSGLILDDPALMSSP